MDVREKLVEKLVELLCSNSSHRGGVTIYDVADHLIANGVTVQEWIPVSKQKPEENKNVRFYVDGNLVFTTVLVNGEEKGVRMANRVNVKPCGIHYLDEHATNGWEWSVENEDVTHWMPLPEPPKGE